MLDAFGVERGVSKRLPSALRHGTLALESGIGSDWRKGYVASLRAKNTLGHLNESQHAALKHDIRASKLGTLRERNMRRKASTRRINDIAAVTRQGKAWKRHKDRYLLATRWIKGRGSIPAAVKRGEINPPSRFRQYELDSQVRAAKTVSDRRDSTKNWDEKKALNEQVMRILKNPPVRPRD